MALVGAPFEAQSPCVTTGFTAGGVEERFRAFAAFPVQADQRAAFGIEILDAAAVFVVGDSTVWAAALPAYKAETGRNDIGDSVIVVALGPTRYFVTHLCQSTRITSAAFRFSTRRSPQCTIKNAGD